MALFDRRSNLSMHVPFDNSSCYFLAQSSGESSLLQVISLQSFSVLIDSDQAGYNLQAYLGCVERKYGNVSILLTFLADSGISIDQFEGYSFE
jgi:hypothetical protein